MLALVLRAGPRRGTGESRALARLLAGKEPWNRGFSGRSSRKGGRGAAEEAVAKEGAAAAAASATTSSAPAAGAAAAGSATDGAGSTATGGGSTTGKPSLFALPLYRKPAFPGFYQIVQVSEQEVLNFLYELRKQGKDECLGGFMTKELPGKLAEAEADAALPLPAGGEKGSATSQGQAQGIRRDAGQVSSAAELEEVGTVLSVVNLTQYPNISGGQVVVMPQKRIRRAKVVSEPSPHVPLAFMNVEYLPEPEVPEDQVDAIKAARLEIIATMKELLKTSFLYREQYEQVIKFYDLENPVKLADFAAGMSLAQRADLQAVLVENDLVKRLNKVLLITKRDLEFARLQSHVKSQVEEKVAKDQKRLMLMEQMKQIKKELGIEKDDKQSLMTQFQEAIKDKVVPEESLKVIEAEIAKLGTLEPSSSEFNVCRTYLEWLTCLPWGQYDTENKDISKAETVLNEDHYGLEDVKERILEHIAVSFLKESVQGKIMCLVGPPGVGKTSVGKSIARSLDRKFFRFSVGGMHDVAELRGHRRTYVGAMPGKLIQCLKITQSSNPVVLIDEIDKLGRDYRGDPSSAFLEILDPEQNSAFRDHYLDVPVDLSRVLFVCTANTTDTIPGPLLDRMEVLRIAGYVYEEKVAIANQYLIPQTAEASGIGSDRLNLHEEALSKMISDYAREAGVRHLRQLLEKVSRKVALSLVRSKPVVEGDEEKPADDKPVEKTDITPDNLTQYIGQPLHFSEQLYASGRTPPGVVVGLAWTSLGGATLFVEARGRVPRSWEARGGIGVEGMLPRTGDWVQPEAGVAKPGSGSVSGFMKVTGQLGSVMNESSAISLTYARLFVRELDPANTFLDEAHVHLNVPEGATPKDGPSAGVTMCSALVSLALNRPLRPNTAMTGELTLTGKVLKVGGIKEKVIAARREGVKTLILPKRNEADYSELKEYLRAGLTAHFVDHFDDVYRLAFDEEQVGALPFKPRGMPVISVSTPLAPSPNDDGPRPLSDAAGAPPAAGDGGSAPPLPEGSTGGGSGAEPSRPSAGARAAAGAGAGR